MKKNRKAVTPFSKALVALLLVAAVAGAVFAAPGRTIGSGSTTVDGKRIAWTATETSSGIKVVYTNESKAYIGTCDIDVEVVYNTNYNMPNQRKSTWELVQGNLMNNGSFTLSFGFPEYIQKVWVTFRKR